MSQKTLIFLVIHPMILAIRVVQSIKKKNYSKYVKETYQSQLI